MAALGGALSTPWYHRRRVNGTYKAEKFTLAMSMPLLMLAAMDRKIEELLLAARWLLLPLYAALLLAMVFVYIMVGREALELYHAAFEGTGNDVVIMLLAVLDLVLIANLLVMVAVSSFESFISKIDVAADADKPEWLGKLDSGNVKIKVSVSIVMISAIHLLRAFMIETPNDRLMVLAGVHVVFVVSALLLALVDRAGRKDAKY